MVPGQVELLDGTSPSRLVAVERNAHNVEPFAFVLVIECLYSRHFCAARSAPRCPKVHKHIVALTAIVRKTLHDAVGVGHFQVGILQTGHTALPGFYPLHDGSEEFFFERCRIEGGKSGQVALFQQTAILCHEDRGKALGEVFADSTLGNIADFVDILFVEVLFRLHLGISFAGMGFEIGHGVHHALQQRSNLFRIAVEFRVFRRTAHHLRGEIYTDGSIEHHFGALALVVAHKGKYIAFGIAVKLERPIGGHCHRVSILMGNVEKIGCFCTRRGFARHGVALCSA